MTFIISIISLFIVKKKQLSRYKNEINELDLEKNMIIGVPILSEISKVKELVKTDNLKGKLDYWDSTFREIKDDSIPKINDMISDAEFLIDKKDYKQAIRKIAYIEMDIMQLKKKSDKLIEEIKVITTSEERNRSLITKLKINI